MIGLLCSSAIEDRGDLWLYFSGRCADLYTEVLLCADEHDGGTIAWMDGGGIKHLNTAMAETIAKTP